MADRRHLAPGGWSELFLAGGGELVADAPAPGSRDYLFLPPTVRRGRNTNPPSMPPLLTWQTRPFASSAELIGPSVLHLEAASTAADTDWIVKLSDVAPHGHVLDLTQGWLRASHRAVDANRSTAWRPYHPHTNLEALTPGKPTSFAIEILSTAHVLRPGHRLRVALTSSDGVGFAMQQLSHYPLGAPARNTVLSSSRLRLPLASTVTR